MTQEVLVAVIMTLCNGLNSNTKVGIRTDYNDSKESRVQCFDKYVNCAIVKDGQILTLKEFNNKCIKGNQ